MRKVSVIIPNWNGEKILKSCLLSIRTINYSPYEVIVVDNGSTDNSIQTAREAFPNVKILNLEKNYGFALPVNIGIKESKGEYIFLLNNDTEIEKNCLGHLVNALENKSELAGVTGKIINIRNKNQIESAGDEINIVGQPLPRGVGAALLEWNQPGFVFSITAGGSLFRKKTFDDVGLFDESFFAYYEDVDWCLRAQLKGLKFWYEPKAIIYHGGKATSKKNRRFLEYLQLRNQTQLIIKNYPWQLFYRRLRWIKIPLVFIHTIYFFIRNGLLKEIVLAELWIIFNLPSLLSKRIAIQKKRKVELDYLEKQMNDKKIIFGFITF